MDIHDMPGHLIRRLNQTSGKVFADRMRGLGHDITSVQYACLETVAAFPGIDQAGVAERIGYDRATIGGVIDRLEAKGLIARSVNADDRRARILTLTADGRSLLETLRPEVAALQDDILAPLSPRERETFIALARKAMGPLG